VLVSALAAAAAGCPGDRTTPATYHAVAPASPHGGAAADGARVAGGRFSRAEVDKAIQAEQDHLLSLEGRIQEADENASHATAAEAAVLGARLRADRTASASFVHQLMACLDDPTVCPPSLDEPLIPRDFDPETGEMTSKVTIDPAKWPETAARLERDACGCRTRVCVDWVLAELARSEAAVPAAVQDDDAAAEHIVGARTCLWERLGEHVRRPTADGADASADD